MKKKLDYGYLRIMYGQEEKKESFGFIISVVIFAIIATLVYMGVARASEIDYSNDQIANAIKERGCYVSGRYVCSKGKKVTMKKANDYCLLKTRCPELMVQKMILVKGRLKRILIPVVPVTMTEPKGDC